MTTFSQVNQIDIDLADADDDNVFADQTLVGAGDFTLDGAGVTDGVWTSPDGFAHQISITSAADESARTATITGFYDIAKNHPASVTLAAVSIGTAETTAYLAVITSVAFDGATSGNVSMGIVDEAIAVVALDRSADPGTVQYVISGTAAFDIETTATPIHRRTAKHPYTLLYAMENWQWVGASTAISASGDLTLNSPTSAVRLKVTSYSSGARIYFNVIQPAG